MPRTGQPAIRLVSAVERAFAVLDTLADADGELGTNEIARRTAVNPSSVSRHSSRAASSSTCPRRGATGSVLGSSSSGTSFSPVSTCARSRPHLHGGFAYNVGEREDDFHAIAAPVWGSRGELTAIIGVQGPASRFDAGTMEAAVGPLLEHSRDVSLELGWSGVVAEAAQR